MCGTPLLKSETTICTRCIASLPYTRYWEYDDNPVAQKFWGQIETTAGCSLLHFRKGAKVRKLIHQLKYKGKTEVGYKLGYLLGLHLKTNPIYTDIDYVVPIPLHPQKLRKRGYNQSDYIAKGIAEALGAKSAPSIVRRNTHTSSQTQKNRIERFQNVRSIFEVVQPHLIEGKHILVVDDVITTGATIESCAAELLNAAPCRVSIASIGTV
jgi:Predicted amidophosphoribosyltransferases